jgi:hypothetical protein
VWDVGPEVIHDVLGINEHQLESRILPAQFFGDADAGQGVIEAAPECAEDEEVDPG